MNVYDFDGTIYKGDSTRDFVYHVLKYYPKVLAYMPPFFLAAIKYKLGMVSKTSMKETLYRFLSCFNLNELENIIATFWETHIDNVYAWYYKKKDSSDVIISASPRFLIDPVCMKFGVNLICSEVNVLNGNCTSENCFGEEKVRRFREIYPDGKIDEFYSDSKSDTPLAKLAKSAFQVKKNGTIIPWSF